MNTSENNFKHRHNQDGSYDSICPLCFRTIATRLRQEELGEDERGHMCEEADLMWRRRKKGIDHHVGEAIDNGRLRA